MEETKELLRKLHADLASVRTDLRKAERTARRNGLIAIGATAAVIIALSLIGAAYIGSSNDAARQAKAAAAKAQTAADTAAQTASDLERAVTCIQTWADATVSRSNTLQPLATKRIEDLFEAFRQALIKGHPVKARQIGLRAIREDSRYLRALHRNPIPKLRKLHCAGPVRKHAAEQPTSHPTPHPSVSTVTTTAPPIYVPGPTVTIRPSPSTKVVTTTVPPGKARRSPPR